jgi:hypothetical protein
VKTHFNPLVYSTISNVTTLNFQNFCNHFLSAVGVIFQKEKTRRHLGKGSGGRKSKVRRACIFAAGKVEGIAEGTE